MTGQVTDTFFSPPLADCVLSSEPLAGKVKLKVVCVCSAPLPFQGTGVVVVVVVGVVVVVVCVSGGTGVVGDLC